MKGQNDEKAFDFIESAKDYMDKLKYRIIVNEGYLKKEFKMITEMASMPQKELDQKFNQVMNDPDNKIAVDYFLYNVKDDDDDINDKIIIEADRLDKTKSLNDLVYLSEKNTRKYKRYDNKRISRISGSKLKNRSQL